MNNTVRRYRKYNKREDIRKYKKKENIRKYNKQHERVYM